MLKLQKIEELERHAGIGDVEKVEKREGGVEEIENFGEMGN